MTTTVKLGDLVLTGLDAHGVRWRTFDPIDGWDGTSGSTFTSTQKPRQHGSWRGPAPKLPERHITLQGVFQAPNAVEAEAACDRLNVAAAESGTTLAITRGATPRTAGVYATACDPQGVTDRVFSWSVALTATDPRKYGPTVSVSTGLPSSTGGLSWPVSWPIEWDGVSASGVVHIDNPGTIDTPVVARLDGPVSGARIRHDGQGAELTLATRYPLAAGSWLDIDMENREILEAGTANRNGWVTDRGWFYLNPGANDVIFTADAYQAAARLTLTYAPAYK